MFKAVAISLFLLIRLGLFIPFISVSAESGGHKSAAYKRHSHKYKKYSKQWRRAYYRRQQRNRALAAHRRAARLRRVFLANTKNVNVLSKTNPLFTANASRKLTAQDLLPALLPSGAAAPTGWKRSLAATGAADELQFRVDDEGGSEIGSASISVVGAATGADSDAGRVKTVGGIWINSLRRTVIDRMVKEEGWVVNDYQKEIGGRKVFVVAAQSPGANGRIQSHLFYFTEAGGRIYSVSTRTVNGSSPRIEQQSELVINSLQRRSVTTQEAARRQN